VCVSFRCSLTVQRSRQATWGDPTAALADGMVDVAFVWFPLPDSERYQWVVVAEEPRVVAMADGHPLAGRDTIDVAELLDEPFLALPASAGPPRDYWLATDVRGGRPARIGAEVASTEDLRGAGRWARRLPAGGGQRAPDLA
jgi:DNA-binding transcriptional LysR family regulator